MFPRTERKYRPFSVFTKHFFSGTANKTST